MTKILGSVGVEPDSEKLSKLLSELDGKDLAEVIAAGAEKLASVPSGGGVAVAAGGGGGGGGGAAAPAEKAAEPEPEEEEEEEEVCCCCCVVLKFESYIFIYIDHVYNTYITCHQRSTTTREKILCIIRTVLVNIFSISNTKIFIVVSMNILSCYLHTDGVRLVRLDVDDGISRVFFFLR